MRRPTRGTALDALIGALLFSLIYLPVPALVAGWVFARDRFYHWDHFIVAQAVAHDRGMALGVDVYAGYGIGWPTLMSSLSDLLPLSYQNVIAFASVFCGLYFVGVFFLFRVAVTQRALALAGTLLTLWLGFFSPMYAATPGLVTNWQWPSILSLRAPFDVLFFLALLLHARSGRPLGSILAAACAGLGLFFETDTGLMLIGVFAVYWTCALLFGGTPGERGEGEEAIVAPIRPWRTLLQSGIAFALVLAAGLSVASHARFLSDPGAVLSGWLGSLVTAVSVSARLFSQFVAEDAKHLPLALGLIGLCLYAVGGTVLKAVHRRLDPSSLFLGCLGFYGAGRLVLFVWNTQAIRAGVVALPAAVLLAVAAMRAIESFERRQQASPGTAAAWLGRLAPIAALLAAAALLVSSPTFTRCPNTWTLARTGLPTSGQFLIADRQEVWLKRPQDRRLIKPLAAAVEKARELTARGERLAVIDPFKTYIYLESGARPWTGDPALFMNTWTTEASGELIDRFLETGPRYVLIRRVPPSSRLILDTWSEFREALRPRYRVVEELPVFDLLLCDSCAAPH